MSIEKLTEEERFWIQRFHGCNHVDKALRIIDQLTEALAAAEVTLHEDWRGIAERALSRADAAERDRDAANALLDECTGCGSKRMFCEGSWPEHKCCPDCSHKPAAPIRTETPELRPGCTTPNYYEPTRTEAEQAVLDAMGVVTEAALRDQLANGSGSLPGACRAELARRGLK